MAKSPNDLLQGSLDMLVMRALRDESRHGWGIQQRINQLAQDALSVNQGSLYPALIRLEKQGCIKSEWGTSEAGRRAKFYSITRKGLKQMEAETRIWKEFSAVVNLILDQA
ncbi:MAG: PadR family transcriptional regulator [Opitutales bacterium]|nr:PadR family transcriptional regulator [Opitutales bacterium]